MNRWRAGLRRWWLLTAAWFAAYLPRVTGRRPAVQLDLGVWIPGWGLRLVLAAVALACGASVVRSPLTGGLMIILAVTMIIWPSGIGPAAVVILTGILAALGPAQSAAGRTALLLLGLHAMVQLALIIGRTSWTARIEVATLLVPLPRFVGVQVLAQAFALLGGWLGGWLGGRDLGLAALPLLAILGLAVVTYAWLPRLGNGPP